VAAANDPEGLQLIVIRKAGITIQNLLDSPEIRWSSRNDFVEIRCVGADIVRQDAFELLKRLVTARAACPRRPAFVEQRRGFLQFKVMMPSLKGDVHVDTPPAILGSERSYEG
jgi:hypothetical protein